jgi:hypothetical protein
MIVIDRPASCPKHPRRDFLRLGGSVAGIAVASLSTAWSPATLAAALACTHAPPAVRVDASLPGPIVDNSQPLRAIAALAPPGYHGGRTIGLYLAQVEAKIEMQFRSFWIGRNAPACVFISGIDVRFAMPTRRIYVASEFWPGTYQHNAVLAHERKHEATDDDVIREHVPRIQQAVRTAAADLGAIEAPAGQQNAAQARLETTVQAAFDKSWAAFMADRSERQRQVDAGLEYARVTASCPDWSQLRQ